MWSQMATVLALAHLSSHAAARPRRLACQAVRIFIAGASGLIGIRLIPLLAGDGHLVAGMTRSPGKATVLRERGALPVVCDVFDACALAQAVAAFRPEVVFHQLTDL